MISDEHQPISTGLELGIDNPFVILLVGTLRNLVFEYQKDRGHSDSEVEQILNIREVLYGILDELHSNEDFKWMVAAKYIGK